MRFVSGRLAAIVLCGAAMLWSQSFQAKISGTVKDPSGGLVAGAQIHLTQLETNMVRTMESDREGRFSLVQLPPGRYRLAVQHPGFRRSEQELTLDVGAEPVLEITLILGQLSESVVVTSEAPLVEAGTGVIGTIIDRTTISNLPLNGRNALDLAAVSPGVVPVGLFGQETPFAGMQRPQNAFAAGGGRAMENDILVDGASVTVGSEFNMPGVTPALDSVQEFKVQLNSYAAEFGRAEGAVVSSVTRSGTNQLHGSAFDFLRNSDLDANDFFNNTAGQPRTSLKWNQFGGTLGGPLYLPRVYDGRNRTFFFVSYEGMRYAQGESTLERVPPDAERSGDFSQDVNAQGVLLQIFDPSSTSPNPSQPGSYIRTPFPGNRIPASEINPVAANVVSYYPQPNISELFPGGPNFFFGGSFRFHSDQAMVKIDHNFTDRQRTSFRYNYYGDGNTFPSSFGNIATPDAGPADTGSTSYVLEHTSLLRPTLVLNLRLSAWRFRNEAEARSAGFDFAKLGMPSSLAEQAATQLLVFPTFNLPTPIGTAFPYEVRNHPFTWNPAGSLSWVKGPHSLKFGADYRAYFANNYIPTDPSGAYNFDATPTGGPNPAAPGITGDAYASFLLGIPTSSYIGKDIAVAAKSTYAALYVQDDWRVTSHLTLNLGLRWDYSGPYTERYNRVTSIDYGTPSPANASVNANYSAILQGLQTTAPDIAKILPTTLDLTGGLHYADSQDRGQTKAIFDNFAPRFGFAFSPTKDWALRGGYAIIYVPQSGINVPISSQLSQGFESVTVSNGIGANYLPLTTLSNPFPGGLIQPPGNTLGVMTDFGASIYSVAYAHRNGYLQQWNLNIQRQLGVQTIIEVGYMGSHGVDLTGQGVNGNFLSPAALALGPAVLNSVVPNPFLGVAPSNTPLGLMPVVTVSQLLSPHPQFTGFTIGSPNVYDSSYNALTVRLERKMSRGLSYLISYTAGKAIDDGANGGPPPFFGASTQTGVDGNNRALDRAISPWDRSQRLVVTPIYELPFGPNKRFGNASRLGRTLGGWQVSGIYTWMTGLPIALSRTAELVGSIESPDNGKGPHGISPSNPWMNPNAFAPLLPNTISNIPATLPNLRGPGTSNLDCSLFKIFRLSEQMRLQLRGDFFNALNHPQFANPFFVPFTPIFGLITSTAVHPRLVQMAVRLSF